MDYSLNPAVCKNFPHTCNSWFSHLSDVPEEELHLTNSLLPLLLLLLAFELVILCGLNLENCILDFLQSVMTPMCFMETKESKIGHEWQVKFSF